VCNDDGVVVLTFDELKQILNEDYEEVEWISASRNRRQMYSIKGSDGKLSFKVGKDEFLIKMFNLGEGTADLDAKAPLVGTERSLRLTGKRSL